MKLNPEVFKTLVVIVAAWFISGCVALQPVPTAARAGDTITLAVGSADGMTTSNTTVEFFAPGVDPDLNPELGTPVPVRNVLRLLPDKTSHAWLARSTSIPRRSSHGAWLSIVVADLPTGLPEGSGTIRVATTSAVAYPRFAATPNGLNIPITILPGTGSPSSFDYSTIDGTSTPGDLTEAESLPHAVIKPEVLPEGSAESESYGAIELDVTVPISNLGGGTVVDRGIAVILDDQPQNISNQTNLIWKRNGNNFNIMLVSPVGMYSYEARISIVPKFPEYYYQISGTPVLNSITYYDLNGVVDTSVPAATISMAP
ncbi:MAG TPA: hypothetical protein ENI62_08190 [Gammaproteobacteria bacterium]|nr:hypothetical protein [Gammaproteobacteria bacterium]